MLRITTLILSSIALVGFSSGASAQSGSPARAASDVDMNDQRDAIIYEQGFRKDPASAVEAYRMAMRFAACTTKMDSKSARSVLATDAGSEAETAALAALMRRYPTCVASRESVPATLVRGAFAETMWTKAGAVANPMKRTTIDMTDIENFFRASPRGEMVAKSGTLPLGWVARCQAMAVPKASATLLATAPGSAEEKAAAAALYSKSSVCGVQNGLGDTIVAYARASVADAIYQDGIRAAAPRQ